MPKLGPIFCQQWSYLHQGIPELRKTSIIGTTLLFISTQKDFLEKKKLTLIWTKLQETDNKRCLEWSLYLIIHDNTGWPKSS